MAFPSTLDAPDTAQVGTTLFTGDDHALQHRTVGSAVIALETKMGLGAGTPTLDTVLKGTGNGTAIWGTLSGVFVTVGTANTDYICDGTADDVQIQAAITALGTAGGEILIKKGTYNLTQTIQLVNGGLIDKIHLCGEGKELTILKMTTGANVGCVIAGKVDRTGGAVSTGIIIENLTVDLNGANQTTTWEMVLAGMDLNNFAECRVSNCKILNVYYAAGLSGAHYGVGINTFDADKSIIENCFFDNCDHGLWITTAAQGDEHYIIVKDNIIQNSKGTGIYHEAGIKTIISNNFIINSEGSGIYAYDHDLTDPADNFIINNHVYDSDGYGIIFKGQHWIVNGNLVRNSGNNSIDFSGLYNKLNNNVIINSGGISADPNLKNGIRAQGNYSMIEGNQIYDTLGTVKTQRGIFLTSVSNCNVIGNTVKGVLVYGIDVSTGNYNTIASNNLNDCCQIANDTYSDIFVGGTSTYNSVIGNNCTDTAGNKAKYGVQEEAGGASNYNVIMGNVVSGAVTANILKSGGNSIGTLNI